MAYKYWNTALGKTANQDYNYQLASPRENRNVWVFVFFFCFFFKPWAEILYVGVKWNL